MSACCACMVPLFLKNVKIVENVKFRKRINSDLKNYYQLVNFHIPNEMLLVRLSNISLSSVNANKDMIFGVTYVSPSTSDYVNKSIFEEMEICLSHFDNCDIMLTGDFNARTGNLLDYIESDINDHSGDENMVDVMNSLNIERKRCNADKTFTQFGSELIDFCISQGLLIMNGRVGRDKGKGNFTCKGVSVVDYFIASPTIFPHVSDFGVCDFDKCLSDVHCPIYAILDVNINLASQAPLLPDVVDVPNSVSDENILGDRFLWNSEKCDQFKEAINKITSFIKRPIIP